MKQKKTVKALLSTLAALTILFASPNVAFAAANSAAVSEAESASITAAETSEADADGNINAAPNTGVPFPPMAAVFLALAMVPVIVLAGRKPSADGACGRNR